MSKENGRNRKPKTRTNFNSASGEPISKSYYEKPYYLKSSTRKETQPLYTPINLYYNQNPTSKPYYEKPYYLKSSTRRETQPLYTPINLYYNQNPTNRGQIKYSTIRGENKTLLKPYHGKHTLREQNRSRSTNKRITFNDKININKAIRDGRPRPPRHQGFIAISYGGSELRHRSILETITHRPKSQIQKL